jgi:glycosyltransferase involved in cell wall biosynthesis
MPAPTTPTPEVSVVVATHNRAERLAATLAGLRAQTLGLDRFEVIIVDDASSDETPAVLAKELEADVLRLRTVRQEQGGGPAQARNRGWQMAQAPMIAFTDDDCVPTPGWLEAMLDMAGQRPDAVVQGPTLPDPREIDALDTYSKSMYLPGPTPHFETCNIVYPRALLEQVSGFDETYPAPAGEDSDLGWRVKAVGGVALFAPDAVVHHAVFPRTPRAALKDALMATHGVQAYKLNPGLREHLTQGVFYERSHPLMLQAAYALWLSRRNPAAVAFAAPYAINVLARARGAKSPVKAAAFHVAYDAVQIAATVRGAVRHRFPLI